MIEVWKGAGRVGEQMKKNYWMRIQWKAQWTPSGINLKNTIPSHNQSIKADKGKIFPKIKRDSLFRYLVTIMTADLSEGMQTRRK